MDYILKNGIVILTTGISNTGTWTNTGVMPSNLDVILLQNAHVLLSSSVSATVALKITDVNGDSRVLGSTASSGTDFYFDTINHPILKNESIVVTNSNTGVTFSMRLFGEEG